MTNEPSENERREFIKLITTFSTIAFIPYTSYSIIGQNAILSYQEPNIKKPLLVHSNFLEVSNHPDKIQFNLKTLPYLFDEASKGNLTTAKIEEIKNKYIRNEFPVDNKFHDLYIKMFLSENGKTTKTRKHVVDGSFYNSGLSNENSRTWGDYSSDILGLGASTGAFGWISPYTAGALAIGSIAVKYAPDLVDFFQPKWEVRTLYKDVIYNSINQREINPEFKKLLDDPEIKKLLLLELNPDNVELDKIPQSFKELIKDFVDNNGSISESDEKKLIEKINNSIASNLDEFGKEVTKQYDSIRSELLSKELKIKRQLEYKKLHNEIEAGINIGTFVLGSILGKPDLANKISTTAHTVHKLYKLTMAFSNPVNGIGYLSLASGYLAGFQAISSVLGGGGSDGTAAILKALKQISKQLQQIQKDINKILENQAVMFNYLSKIYQKLEQISEQISFGNTSISSDINDLQISIDSFRNYEEVTDRQEALKEFSDTFDKVQDIYLNNLGSLPRKELRFFKSYSLNTSKSTYFSESDIQSWDDDRVIKAFEFEVRLDYLTSMIPLIINYYEIGNQGLISNPIEWARGANSYIELLSLFPKFRESDLYKKWLLDILKDGIKTRSAFSLLTKKSSREIIGEKYVANGKKMIKEFMNILNQTYAKEGLNIDSLKLNPTISFPEDFRILGRLSTGTFQYNYAKFVSEIPKGDSFLFSEQPSSLDFGGFYKFKDDPIKIAMDLRIIKLNPIGGVHKLAFTDSNGTKVYVNRRNYQIEFLKGRAKKAELKLGDSADNSWRISTIKSDGQNGIKTIQYLPDKHKINSFTLYKIFGSINPTTGVYTGTILEFIKYCINDYIKEVIWKSFNAFENRLKEVALSKKMYSSAHTLHFTYAIYMMTKGMNINSASTFFINKEIFFKNSDNIINFLKTIFTQIVNEKASSPNPLNSENSFKYYYSRDFVKRFEKQLIKDKEIVVNGTTNQTPYINLNRTIAFIEAFIQTNNINPN